jgi:hypothetical protein
MTPFIFGFVRYSTAGYPMPQQPGFAVPKCPDSNRSDQDIQRRFFRNCPQFQQIVKSMVNMPSFILLHN